MPSSTSSSFPSSIKALIINCCCCSSGSPQVPSQWASLLLWLCNNNHVRNINQSNEHFVQILWVWFFHNYISENYLYFMEKIFKWHSSSNNCVHDNNILFMYLQNKLTISTSRFHIWPHRPWQIGHGLSIAYPPHSIQLDVDIFSHHILQHL